MILGRQSYIGFHRIHNYSDGEEITIGNYCSIGDDVEFLPGGMHDLEAVSTFPWQLTGRVGRHATPKGPIVIGHDVWIGRGVRFIGGATVGNGAVIGAYAVVAGHVPPYHVAVGNPARCHPRPTHHRYVDALYRIAWWDWPDDDPRLDDVEQLPLVEFCAKHDPEGSRQ